MEVPKPASYEYPSLAGSVCTRRGQEAAFGAQASSKVSTAGVPMKWCAVSVAT
jgi:hypothetical protein